MKVDLKEKNRTPLLFNPESFSKRRTSSKLLHHYNSLVTLENGFFHPHGMPNPLVALAQNGA
jgi:hypothetical protein